MSWGLKALVLIALEESGARWTDVLTLSKTCGCTVDEVRDTLECLVADSVVFVERGEGGFKGGGEIVAAMAAPAEVPL